MKDPNLELKVIEHIKNIYIYIYIYMHENAIQLPNMHTINVYD